MSQAGAQPVRVLGVVGSTHPQERTRALTDAIVGAAAEGEGVSTSVVALGEGGLAIADGTRAEEQEGFTREMLDAVNAADAFVLGTPIYRATFSGLLKNFLDLVPRGDYDGNTSPFRAKPIIVAATAAAPQHFLGLTELIQILTNFFGAYVVPPGVFASRTDFDGDGNLSNAKVVAQAEQSGHALVPLSRAIAASEALAGVGPQL